MKKQIGSDQKHFVNVFGGKAVEAVFKKRPQGLKKLFYTIAQKKLIGPWCKHLAQDKKPYMELKEAEMDEMLVGQDHEGIAAIITRPALKKFYFSQLGEWYEAGETFILLDSVRGADLGVIAQAANYFGVKKLLLSKKTCEDAFTSEVWSASGGAIESIELYSVNDMESVLRNAHSNYLMVGYLPVGKGGRNVNWEKVPNAPGKLPAFVFSGDSEGAQKSLCKHCECLLQFPGLAGAELSIGTVSGMLLGWVKGRKLDKAEKLERFEKAKKAAQIEEN